MAGESTEESGRFFVTFTSAENVTFSLRICNLRDDFARSPTSFLAQSAPLPGRDIWFGANAKF